MMAYQDHLVEPLRPLAPPEDDADVIDFGSSPAADRWTTEPSFE